MNEHWGPGITRDLSALARSFTAVVWQDDKPPMDAELNLMSQIDWENLSNMVRSQVHSGFFIDPTRCQDDFLTQGTWSNQFVIAPVATVSGSAEAAPSLIACVNGWVFPVAGTDVASASPDDMSNRIRLNPPPSSDRRTDFVFLEVWRALVSPTPSTVNKPSAGYLWKYGNVQYGGTNVPDDLIDPGINIETTKRVQLQYRIRVVGSGDSLGTSVDLVTYPDGLTDPQVRAQGTAGSDTSFAFTNMRQELGDPSLWRAGDGNPSNTLGTVDGYVYAIPMVAVYRRNSTDFTAISFSGTSNQNGAVDRTPSTRLLPNPRTGARALTQATLTATLGPNTVGAVALTGLTGSGLDDTALFPTPGQPRFVVVGDGPDQEIIGITSVNTGAGTMFIDPSGRGRGGSAALGAGRRHPAGTTVRLYNTNPYGLYADQIDLQDLQDLRRSVSFGGWDYNQLLQHAVAGITQNSLRTSAKAAGTGGNTRGVVTTEVSYLHSPQAVGSPTPADASAVDGPDGIRTVWSDAAVVQRDVSVILDPQAPISNGVINAFDTNLSQNWAPSADWQPHGFLNLAGGAVGWTNGSVVFLHIGGVDGAGGARWGLQGGQKSVRFIAPREAWVPGGTEAQGDQHPWRLRFVGGPSGNTTTPSSAASNGYIAARITSPPAPEENAIAHPGPMYPVAETNFERPFIVLGDILNPAFVFPGVPASSTNFTTSGGFGLPQINIPGANWNTIDLNSFPMGRDGRTLRDLLTNDGQDATGSSSQLYIVVYGDTDSRDNNGCFRVIGAGTIAAQSNDPYTQFTATTASGLVVTPLSSDFQSFFNSTKSVTIEFRSQEILAELDDGKLNPAGIAVVMTDLQSTNPGGVSLPWAHGSPTLWDDGTRLVPVNSKVILDTDILWSPNRGASQRVPDRVGRFSSLSGDATGLRTAVSAVDSAFVAQAPYPSGERTYESHQIQLWNRLPSRGYFPSGKALSSDMWGGKVVGSSEQDREAELFVDPGSKTVVFRPFMVKNMTLKGLTTAASPNLIGGTTYTLGSPAGQPIDAAGIFTTGLTLGYQVPQEYMPRFGRQDIPYHTSSGAVDPVLPGINHLFADQATVSATSTVFWVIGGENNATSGSLVSPMLFTTNTATASYGRRGTIGGALHPATGARRQYYGDVISSDLGVGMRGIELPPYHGIARVYGVYEYNDFVSHLSGTYPGGFQGDRVTPIADPPRNLLKVGASRQTLFIRQGGGQDVTGNPHSHTYLIPESALDIASIPGFTAGQTFTDYQYVVECVVFGFAVGFINQNNFVLARRKTGQGTAVTEGANPELSQLAMVLPSPASRGDGLYEVFERTVYQGDPYFTRGGTVAQSSDFAARYGQLDQADAIELNTEIQQFNSTTGAMSVTRPNPRALQILASLDFYTTLGTGKMGGKMWPGTVLDCGFVAPGQSKQARLPTLADDPPWKVVPRAFTCGQRDNTTYASIEVAIRNYSFALTYHLTVVLTTPFGGRFEFVAPTDFGGGLSPSTSNTELADSLAAAINDAARSYVYAVAKEGVVLITSVVPGSLGNQFRIQTSVRPAVPTSAGGPILSLLTDVATVLRPNEQGVTLSPNQGGLGALVTGAYFVGGVDVPTNAGSGDSVVSLTGMTERLPLGILVSDSDFMAEDVLNNRTSSFRATTTGFGTVYDNLPLTRGGMEYTRFVSDPGSMVALSDGAILRYTPYSAAAPTGATSFRLYRGGGAVMMLSGQAPGGPVSWVSDSFPASLQPVLKGAVLACKALLVRNYPERAFSGNVIRSEGDEIQVVILTYAVYGTSSSTQDGVALKGVISPTGYGEGYAAADRYLIQGRPMDRGRSRVAPPPGLPPAPYFKE